MLNNKKIYIIGGGVSGLAAACFLKNKGFNVCIIEKNNTLGGRLFEYEENGFRFNNGPSWYWMKDVFDEVYEEIGISKKDVYKLNKLDPQYKMVFDDEEFVIPGEYKKTQEMFSDLSKSNKLESFINKSHKKYDIARKIFLRYNNLSFTEYLNLETIKNIIHFDFNISYREYCKKFSDNKHLQKILEWPSLFIGSSPKKISAMYSMLTYSMIHDGTFLPEDGLVDIVKVLTKRANELDVEIKLNESVKDYIIKNKKIIGIKTNNSVYKNVESIIAGCDYQFNESILPRKFRTYPKSYWEKIELCPSCLLFHIGINKKLETDDFHVLFFDNNLDSHMNEIYNLKTVPENPLFYLNITSKKLKTAPDGHENLFILIPTGPHMIITNETVTKYYDYVINKIEKYYDTKIKENIVCKKIFKDSDFKSRFNAYGGNAYGLSCHPLQSAFLKPRIKSRYLNNLYYCGQLTNPGPGVPPSLLSGIVTSKYFIKNRNKSNKFNFGESLTLVIAIFARTLSLYTTIKIILKEIIYIFSGYIL